MCRQLLSDETVPAAVENTAAVADGYGATTPASSSPRPASNGRRSSYSGTASDGRPSNGPCGDASVLDSDDCSTSRPEEMSRRPLIDSAPPVPPPRRYGVRQSGFGEVWQRQTARPATDVVHRRVLAAPDNNGPLSAPNSCPSSPLLDAGGPRRGDGVGQSQVVGGRRTHLPPSQNDREAATRGFASPPVSRRTKLPLSPLARTQRDVR